MNNIQIGGISFIERLSFQAFNEGIRLKGCIRLQQRLTKTRVKTLASHSIYANNENRKFCTQYGIATSFVRKGRATKDEKLRKILRSELSRERATHWKEASEHRNNIILLQKSRLATEQRKTFGYFSEYIRPMQYA